jgi:hypothetical protein
MFNATTLGFELKYAHATLWVPEEGHGHWRNALLDVLTK